MRAGGMNLRGRFATRPLGFALAVLVMTAAVAVAAPGDLDETFDADGKKTIDHGGDDLVREVLAQPDGKIVLVGYSEPNSNMLVTRLNPDGSPDLGFDGDGTAVIDFGAVENARGAALQADGKIVVVGATVAGMGAEDLAVARLNVNGSPDSSFDADGKRTIDLGGAYDGWDAVVQPDGKIVTLGNGTQGFVVTRLNPDGSPDSGFDGDGAAVVDFATVDFALAAGLQADGKIVVAGARYSNGNEDVAVGRLNANGSPDNGFDADGKKTIDYGGDDFAEDVVVQPDQKIVLAGRGNGDFRVTRLNPDGSPDAAFDGDGAAAIDFGGTDNGYGAALQANGKIVLAGTTSADADAAIARLQPGGAPDTTFSFDGKQTIDFPQSAVSLTAALQPDGKIVTAGYALASFDFMVARLDGDPVGSGGGPSGAPGGQGSVPRCAGRRATIVGTAGRERLRGTRRADVIVALGGNDSIRGGRGNDRICAGTGNDSIAGGAGGDRIEGQAGKDKALGGSGNDHIEGGPASDRLVGQSGKDRILGGSGNDKIDGGSSKDRMSGNGGRDLCSGGGGQDRADCESESGV